ncbi:MAG TPA: transglycosylase domain-containing protein [Acidimicrobiales bacterium]|nr:transglycosylase domain-containing protein [Acidimicrobiales bacterium]
MRRAVLAVTCLLVAAGCSYTKTEVVPEIPANAQSSQIFAADGSLITTLQAPENRVEVPLARIPVIVQNAVISIEDERFYYHHGVDFRAIFRAAQKNVEEGTAAQGASTITQQLVKNTLLNSGKTLDRKIQEASLAWQLEEHYSKQRILEIYLNTVYFGNGAYGVEAAAQEYFGRHVDQIDAVQGATLAALIQAPSTYDPLLHPDAAVGRRNTVLQKMRDQGFLTPEEHDRDIVQPLGLSPTPVQDRYPAAHFVNEVKKFIENDARFGSTQEERDRTLFAGGLRIYTTVDLQLQAAAEAAINDVMPDPAGPEAALVAVDPQTGFVRAMVGGRDFFGTQPTAKCNLAIGCKPNPGRGTGSAFKPFVLAAALTQGIPLSEIIPAPGCIHLDPPTGPWDPCNADPGEGAPGGTDLIEGTVHSFNTLYAQLILQVGPQNGVDMAKKLGVTTPLKALPSAVLGANDVTVLDMASAYGTFANRGVHVAPTMITKITRADGTILYENPHHATKAIDAGVADTVTSVLQQVIARGTGTAAKEDFPVAGKTGTGEDYKNAWFCGYSTSLATAVWVGYPQDERTSLTRPNTPITVYGGTWPAQIWQEFMAAAHDRAPSGDFVPPPPPTTTTTQPGGLPPGLPDFSAGLPVPDTRGKTFDEAAAIIQHAGFVPSRFDFPTTAVPPGVVVAQSPQGTTTAPPGATVTVEVSVSPDQAVTVADVVGETQKAATRTLQGEGLEVQATEAPPPDDRQPPGHVWKQSPAAGSTVSKGTTVTIFVTPG